LTGLVPNTLYSFSVKARDASGNISAESSPLSVKTLAASGILPTAPGNVAISSTSYSSITLSWTPSSSSSGISTYDVYKGGTRIVTLDASTTSVLIGGLDPATPYAFSVTARDSQGNVSPNSSSATATTRALPAEGAISNVTGNYNKQWLTLNATYNLAFGFEHVFIDADNNPGTGWVVPSSPSLGADYMVENNTVYQFAGKSGSDWVWNLVNYTLQTKDKSNSATWTLRTRELFKADPAPTVSVVFQGNGFAETAHSRVIKLNLLGF